MTFYETSDARYDLDKLPDTCARCRRNIAAIRCRQASANDDSGYFECVFRCPACDRHFIACYQIPRYGHIYELTSILPVSYSKRTFPLIASISDRFEILFNQSAAAESEELTEIAGTGYRKALEFLIKDYCVAVHPEKRDIIRSTFLGNVIRDHLEDGRLKRAATLTAWLGNDETHYERRWVDKDLRDLKALLELTITFINEEIQLEQYTISMQPEVKPKFMLSTLDENN